MNREAIAIRIDKYAKEHLEGVPFDKGLPVSRKILWEIADEEGTDGATIFGIYMDWKSKNNK